MGKGSVVDDLARGAGDILADPVSAVLAPVTGLLPAAGVAAGVTAVEESVEGEVSKIRTELEGAIPKEGIPAPPTPDTKEVIEESDKAVVKERRRAGRRGRASTLLTGGRGVKEDEDGSVSRRTLLGA